MPLSEHTRALLAEMTRDWRRRHPLVLTLEDHARRQVAEMRAGSLTDGRTRAVASSRRTRRLKRTLELMNLDPWDGVNA